MFLSFIFPPILAARRQSQYGGVTFDGANDLISRGSDLTGSADSKVGLFSFWAMFNYDDAEKYIFNNESVYFYIRRSADNSLRVAGTTDPGNSTLQLNTSAIASGAWHHVMGSWNLATAVSHLYVDNISDNSEVTNANNNIDYTRTDWAIGATVGGVVKIAMDLAEFYFAMEYLDLSNSANRAKFITAAGKPANLGNDGSLPTGTQPIIYQAIRIGNAASVFAENKGSGGNFSITGALGLASTLPSI